MHVVLLMSSAETGTSNEYLDEGYDAIHRWSHYDWKGGSKKGEGEGGGEGGENAVISGERLCPPGSMRLRTSMPGEEVKSCEGYPGSRGSLEFHQVILRHMLGGYQEFCSHNWRISPVALRGQRGFTPRMY